MLTNIPVPAGPSNRSTALRTFLAIAIGSASFSLLAQTSEQSQRPVQDANQHNMADVVQIAPLQIEAKLSVERSALKATELKLVAPNAMEVIEGEQLQQYNEQALGDAMRRLPGVTFEKANRTREVRLRGLPGEYTQVFVNGRPLIDGGSRRNFELDRIPAGLVERIEVVRSPRASMQGQGAAGTINIVLKNGVDLAQQSELTVGAGYLDDNGGQGELGFSTGQKVGALEMTLAGSIQQYRRSETKDEFEFDETGAPDGGELGFNQRRFEQVNFIPRFAVTSDSAGRFEFNPYYMNTTEFRDDTKTKLKDDQNTPKEVKDEDRERKREAYGLNAGWEKKMSATSSLKATIDWQQGETATERDAVKNKPGKAPEDEQRSELIEFSLIRPELIFSHQSAAHELNLGAGLELRQHDEHNASVKKGVPQAPKQDRVFEIDEDVTFAFVEDIWQLNKRLQLTTGLRIEDSKTQTTDFFGANTSQDATFLLPSVNATFELDASTDLRFGVARTLRRPDLRSLTPSVNEEDGTITKPDVGGNPLQEPESIWGLDVGIDRYFEDSAAYVSLNLFARQFNDKIESTLDNSTGRFIATPENVGDAIAMGAEFSFRTAADVMRLQGLSLWGNAGYIDSTVELPDGSERAFLGQADFVSNLGVDYALTPWKTTFGLSLNFVPSLDQTQQLSGGGSLAQSISSRTRVDLSSQTELTKNLSLTVSLTNLLGETAQQVSREFDGAGALVSTIRTDEPTFRTFYARVNYQF